MIIYPCSCYWRWSLDDRECSVPWIRRPIWRLSWIGGKSMIILSLWKDVMSISKLSVIKIIIQKSKLTLSQIIIHNNGSVKGKLHCKPQRARVTWHSFGSWQWMVMCTRVIYATQWKFFLPAVDTRSGKRLYRKRTVVNVAFTGSIPGIVISTGNAKWIN